MGKKLSVISQMSGKSSDELVPCCLNWGQDLSNGEEHWPKVPLQDMEDCFHRYYYFFYQS